MSTYEEDQALPAWTFHPSSPMGYQRANRLDELFGGEFGSAYKAAREAGYRNPTEMVDDLQAEWEAQSDAADIQRQIDEQDPAKIAAYYQWQKQAANAETAWQRMYAQSTARNLRPKTFQSRLVHYKMPAPVQEDEAPDVF